MVIIVLFNSSRILKVFMIKKKLEKKTFMILEIKMKVYFLWC